MKIVKATREQSAIFYGILWYLITVFALYGLVWPCVALCGLVRPCVALYGLIWSCCCFSPSPCVASFNIACLVWSCMAFLWSYMAFYGLIWHFMVLYGILWSYMAFYGLLWQYFFSYCKVVIDPNSFCLVKIRFGQN